MGQQMDFLMFRVDIEDLSDMPPESKVIVKIDDKIYAVTQITASDYNEIIIVAEEF